MRMLETDPTLNSQTLTEEDTPGLEISRLATMELIYTRCIKMTRNEDPASSYFRNVSERSTTQINERTKKGLSSITE
jgi:hypothetical protein